MIFSLRIASLSRPDRHGSHPPLIPLGSVSACLRWATRSSNFVELETAMFISRTDAFVGAGIVVLRTLRDAKASPTRRHSTQERRAINHRIVTAWPFANGRVGSKP